MAMNRAQFAKLLQEGLNVVFGMEYKQYPEEYRKIYETSKSGKAFEEDQLVVGLGGAQVKPEGQGVFQDAGAQSYTSRYLHDTTAISFHITEEAVEDGLYGNLGEKYARSMARSLQHTQEVRGAATLNNGFDSTYPGGDGTELFGTHTLWNGATLANELATPADLDETSLELALIGIAGFVNDRSIPIHVMAKRLIVPKELIFDACRILDSPLQNDSANNAINAIRSKGYVPEGAFVNHRLTDTDAWFLITDCPYGLRHFDRIGVQRGMEGDFNTGNLRYKARRRDSFGWTDFRGAYGSPGSGS